MPIPRGPNHPMKNRLACGNSERISASSTAAMRTTKMASSANSTIRQSAERHPSITANAPNMANTVSSNNWATASDTSLEMCHS